MSFERVKVRAKTTWRKSENHAWHKKGDVFDAPADWLPCRYLEIVDDGTREADRKLPGDEPASS